MAFEKANHTTEWARHVERNLQALVIVSELPTIHQLSLIA